MIRVKINTFKSYDVVLAENILDKCGSFAKDFIKGRKVVIVTDDNVSKLYLETVTTSFKAQGFYVDFFVIANGEQSKSMQNYLDLQCFLADKLLTRNDFLVALGGGVVGDLTGFVAATYLRGIDFMQIPTTLLSIIDSSVGGKSAINLPNGKNLVGAFHQPSLVVADTLTLKTLDDCQIKNGMGELIKTAILAGGELFALLENGQTLTPEVLQHAICYKKHIVENDEFEKGLRKLLNLGHTIGHAIEKLSNFEISHGQAVASGIRIIAKASLKNNTLGLSSYTKIIRLLDKYGFKNLPDYSYHDLAKAAINDKKISGENITLVTIKDIAECVLTTLPTTYLEEFITC